MSAQDEKPLLQIKNLHKKYDDLVALSDISLEVRSGEVVVVLGPSGCGKSTLLRCINGLEEIQSGEILLDGKIINLDKTQWHLIRQKIGMVFQSYDLFPHMTILENVLLTTLNWI